MNATTLLALSAGLAMDATAVSAARGLTAQSLRTQDVVRVALLFGGFQALMPLVGWFLGDALGPWVTTWTHWIAFVVLGTIGGKMLWEARGGEDAQPPTLRPPTEVFGTRILLVLALATSVDALVVGITLPMLGAPMVLSLASIGLVTAVSSAAGLVAGRRLGLTLGRRLDAFGGLVLVALGSKILLAQIGML